MILSSQELIRQLAVECRKLAELSNETDRRALIEMAADWHALADKVRQREANPRLREANPQEQEPAPVSSPPKSPEPSDTPVRPKRPLAKKARTPVQTVVLKSR
jgi:hypothetical protein